MDPWGTPDETIDQVDTQWFMQTLCLLPVRNFSNHLSRWPFIPQFSSLRSLLWGTVSKALEKSRKTA